MLCELDDLLDDIGDILDVTEITTALNSDLILNITNLLI